jgi:hypothetical protein
MPELQQIPEDVSQAILKFVNEKQTGDILLRLNKGYIQLLEFTPQPVIIPREKLKTFTGDKK